MHCQKDHKDDQLSCNCAASTTCIQSLDDMEFERGIWYAAQYGDICRVRKLAIHGVDKLDKAGYTALHYAARAGYLDICNLLLSLGSSPNVQTRAGLATALHRAASSGKTEIVRILIAAGANVNLQDSDGQTALHRAAAAGHFDIVKLLLTVRDISVSSLDNRGRSPYDLALESTPAQPIDILNLLKL